MEIVSRIVDKGLVYSGPDSQVELTTQAFGNSNSTGATTVGEWFAKIPGAQALTQYNGDAVFFDFSQFTGVLSPFTKGTGLSQLGRGTLLHEILHKAGAGGFDHPQMTDAGRAVGIFGKTGNNQSSILAQACFNNQ